MVQSKYQEEKPNSTRLIYRKVGNGELEGIKPGMELIGASVDFKLLAFHFKPLFTQKFCSCSYTTAV